MLEYIQNHFNPGIPGAIGFTVGAIGLSLFTIGLVANLRQGKPFWEAVGQSPGGSALIETADKVSDLFIILDYIEYLLPYAMYEDDAFKIFKETCKKLDYDIDVAKAEIIWKDLLKGYSKSAQIKNAIVMNKTTDDDLLKLKTAIMSVAEDHIMEILVAK